MEATEHIMIVFEQRVEEMLGQIAFFHLAVRT